MLFGEDATLTRVNTVCDVLRDLSPKQCEVIDQGLMQNKYQSPADLLAAMKVVKVERLNISSGGGFEGQEDAFKEIADKMEQLKHRISAIRESQSDDESLKERLSNIQNILSHLLMF